MICVFINMTGTPEGSTESGFMEKPGIEPATPGLQGIALIHYTTGALIDFSLTVKAATLIFISGRGSAISSTMEGKSGFIHNLVKSY